MSDLAIFAISTRRMEWLAARQSAVASNIANADTPGYRARDVAEFSSFIDGSRLDVATTSNGHLSFDTTGRFGVRAVNAASGEAKHSGNTVSLEHEMVRAGELQGQHTLAVSVVRAFNQMLASAVRG
ncbi:MAG: flagellar basal body rod protein FlgB [Alphaproteobacteria bacterium]|nr:flagellar basal body rod protein FlgB [Alphaproteobacteria bacterium]